MRLGLGKSMQEISQCASAFFSIIDEKRTRIPDRLRIDCHVVIVLTHVQQDDIYFLFFVKSTVVACAEFLL